MIEALKTLGFYFLNVAATTVSLFLALLGPSIVWGSILHVMSGGMQRFSIRLLHEKIWLYAVMLPGTPIHELGHAIFALLFGHRITSMKLFSPNADDDALGSVEHAYDPRNLYHQVGHFFIGVAPLIVGTAVVYLAAHLLIPRLFGSILVTKVDGIAAGTLDGLVTLLRLVPDVTKAMLNDLLVAVNFGDWRFYLFVYLAFVIGNSMRLSRADLRGAYKGFLVILVSLFFCVAATHWMGRFWTNAVTWAGQLSAVLNSIMLFVILINAILLLIAFVVARTLRRRS